VPRIHFQSQLVELKDKLMAMAALSQQAVEAAAEAYVQRDKSLCKYVKQTETAINSAQREIDEMAYELLAKEQPMAVDLRFILSVLKISGDLERIGDQAHGIGHRTRDLIKLPECHLPVDYASMGEYATKMIRTAIQSLFDEDAQLAESVSPMDDEIDKMNYAAHDSLLAMMQKQPEMVPQAMNGILVAKNLERIADHASAIATDVIFWLRGADLRHQYSMSLD